MTADSPKATPDEVAAAALVGETVRAAAQQVRADIDDSYRGYARRLPLIRQEIALVRSGALTVVDWLDQWADNLENPDNPPHPRGDS